MPTTVIPVGGDGVVSGYKVFVGCDLLVELPNILGEQVKQVLVVYSQTVLGQVEVVKSFLSDAGYKVLLAEVPDGDAAKNVQVAQFCWQVLAQSNFSRSDVLVSVGGGSVSDLAGFVAATWLRGVRVVHMPTSLLGMVDAAIGGKTGINIVEGKNLVGAFHAPSAVLVDLKSLLTLPEHEFVSGMAEIVKAGFIADTTILDIFEAKNFVAEDVDFKVLQQLIVLAIKVKVAFVCEDFRENGRREFLNYGHTLGHAIEFVERYRFRHGAAVSIGLVYAAELGRLVGALSEDVVVRHRNILGSLGLPVSYRGDRWESLLGAMRRDKKVRGGLLRFVVLQDVGRPVVCEAPDLSLLFAAFQEIAD